MQLSDMTDRCELNATSRCIAGNKVPVFLETSEMNGMQPLPRGRTRIAKIFRGKPKAVLYVICRALGAGGALAGIVARVAVEMPPGWRFSRGDVAEQQSTKTKPRSKATCLPGFLIMDFDAAACFFMMGAWYLASGSSDEQDIAVP